MNREPTHSMKIQNLRLEVRLGCSTEERSVPQEVGVSVELRFSEVPRGTVSDDLKDTVCYAKISEALRAHIKGREFCLVEKMAADFREILKPMIEGRAEISLSVHKVRPPIDGLLGGVEYRIGDFA